MKYGDQKKLPRLSKVVDCAVAFERHMELNKERRKVSSVVVKGKEKKDEGRTSLTKEEQAIFDSRMSKDQCTGCGEPNVWRLNCTKCKAKAALERKDRRFQKYKGHKPYRKPGSKDRYESPEVLTTLDRDRAINQPTGRGEPVVAAVTRIKTSLPVDSFKLWPLNLRDQEPEIPKAKALTESEQRARDWATMTKELEATNTVLTGALYHQRKEKYRSDMRARMNKGELDNSSGAARQINFIFVGA